MQHNRLISRHCFYFLLIDTSFIPVNVYNAHKHKSCRAFLFLLLKKKLFDYPVLKVAITR